MSGLLLRLAGPMQSWGERSTFDLRDTASFPSRSGLIGLLACTLGHRRGQSLDDLGQLSFTTRIDRPGVRLVDYQTTGGWLPHKGPKVPTADGKGRPEGKGTVQTWREYLSDAVFIVAVTGPSEAIEQAREGLRRPHWQPFLGRRSYPPDEPLLLERPVEDAVAELHHVPLARRVRGTETEVEVDFVHPDGPSAEVYSEINDVPTTFTNADRSYRSRPIWRSTVRLPAELGVPSLADYPERLTKYLHGDLS